MRLMIRRYLDIRKAKKRASLFSNISGLCGCTAIAIAIITALTMDSEHSDLYYVVTLLVSVVLAVIAFVADRVATHIRELIDNSIREENEVKWRNV